MNMNERHRTLYSLAEQFMARWIQMRPAKWAVQPFILFPADIFPATLLARSTPPHLFPKKGSFLFCERSQTFNAKKGTIRPEIHLSLSHIRFIVRSSSAQSNLVAVFYFIVLLPLALLGTSGRRVLIFFCSSFVSRFCFVEWSMPIYANRLSLHCSHGPAHNINIVRMTNTRCNCFSASSRIRVSCGSTYVPVRLYTVISLFGQFVGDNDFFRWKCVTVCAWHLLFVGRLRKHTEITYHFMNGPKSRRKKRSWTYASFAWKREWPHSVDGAWGEILNVREYSSFQCTDSEKRNEKLQRQLGELGGQPLHILLAGNRSTNEHIWCVEWNAIAWTNPIWDSCVEQTPRKKYDLYCVWHSGRVSCEERRMVCSFVFGSLSLSLFCAGTTINSTTRMEDNANYNDARARNSDAQLHFVRSRRKISGTIELIWSLLRQ